MFSRVGHVFASPPECVCRSPACCQNRLKFLPQAFKRRYPSVRPLLPRYSGSVLRNPRTPRLRDQVAAEPRTITTLEAFSTNFDKSLVNRMSGFLDQPTSPLSSRCSEDLETRRVEQDKIAQTDPDRNVALSELSLIKIKLNNNRRPRSGVWSTSASSGSDSVQYQHMFPSLPIYLYSNQFH